MSSLANWSYTPTLTIWPAATENRYGDVSYGVPYTLQGDWGVGGDTLTNDDGEEFVAKSVYYIELSDGNSLLPNRGDFILRGDNTGETDPHEAGAEQIQMVKGWNMTMFGPNEIPDWKIAT